MSADLELALSKVRNLSVEELLTLQETITYELRHKIKSPANGNGHSVAKPSRHVEIPGAIRRSPEEIEAHLVAIFGSEKLAELKGVDLTNLPPGHKTIIEMLSEDREDRF